VREAVTGSAQASGGNVSGWYRSPHVVNSVEGCVCVCVASWVPRSQVGGGGRV
jgi:hypothetical protein